MILVTSAMPFADEHAAIGYAIRIFRPHALSNIFGQWHRRDKPAWQDPNILLQIASSLNL